MHGSFALIKSTELKRGAHNILQTSWDNCSCSFAAESHNSNQWWTIKSVDHPYVGSKIKNGDKIYLENHIYYDLIQYVPCRLTKKDAIYSGQLKTQAIIEIGSDQLYWTIEKL